MSWPTVVLWINIIWAIVAIFALTVYNSVLQDRIKKGKDESY